MRKKDSYWQYANDLHGHFVCNFCGVKYSGGVSRLKSHLSRISGRDINGCPKVPEDIQAAAAIAIGCGSNKKRTFVESNEGSQVCQSSSDVHQTTIPAMTNKKNKDHVDLMLADHFFKNNIPFNVIQTRAFLDMVKAIADFGAGYLPPSYSTLRTKLVVNRRKAVEEYVDEVKASWVLCGCTIMSDIWTDMNGRSYINVIASSPKGSIFLRSFERSDKQKTGIFLRDILVSVIEEIGPQNVVQVVTDNASNYGLAGELIMDKYPHIYKVRCAAHGIQLLLKDIYVNVRWVKNVFDDAKVIVDYMYKHTIILSLMREYTDKELKKYSKVRFASHFLMLQSVLEAEEGLRHTVASTTWINLPYNTKPDYKKVENVIHNSDFWRDEKEVLSSLEPLIRVLRLVDGNGSTAGYIYEAMERAREWFRKLSTDDSEKYSRILQLFESRRYDNILHEVHAAAAYLNPTLMYDRKILYDQPDVRDGLLFLGNKMLSIDEREAFGDQLLVYDGRHPKMFHYLSLGQMKSAHPRVWWEANGSMVPILKKIAIRILSQPCSASACERNWSAFDAAQTKKRNRLLPDMLEDLVYIRVNSMMFDTSKDLEIEDRKAINLDSLGELPHYTDDSHAEEFENVEDASEDTNIVGGSSDTSWLDSRLGIGPSSF